MTITNDGLTRSLDASYYIDPAIFDQERDAIFARTWQFAGHASKLEHSGNFLNFTVAGNDLHCIRDVGGQLRTFFNASHHQGLEVRTEVFCGFVFVNLDPLARPMGEWYPGVAAELREYVPNVEQLKPLSWVEVPEACNWKVSVENYAECYHCAVNHPTYAGGVAKTKNYDIQPQGHCLRHTADSQSPEKMSYPIDLANEHACDVATWYLWPCFSFQVYPGNTLNTYHWQPVDVDHVIVWRGWLTENGEESDVIRRLAAQDRDTTVAEDVRLVESVQRGMRSRGYSPGPLVIDASGHGVNSEHALHTLQTWIRDALDGAGR
jgi:phenylpropionate dioxygenase-like ring-hydroxylating dioxygenase large terminal subunit